MPPRLTTSTSPAATRTSWNGATPRRQGPGNGRPRQDRPARLGYHPAPRAGLSTADVAVLTLLADGHTQDTTARRLDMSTRTLRRRITGICAELQVREPIEAVVWAAKHGIL